MKIEEEKNQILGYGKPDGKKIHSDDLTTKAMLENVFYLKKTIRKRAKNSRQKYSD